MNGHVNLWKFGILKDYVLKSRLRGNLSKRDKVMD